MELSFTDWLWLAAGIGLVAVGIYIKAEPGRLFIRDEDPSAYRPEAVEYDSEHGRFLRKAAPFYIVAGLALVGYQIIKLLSE